MTMLFLVTVVLFLWKFMIEGGATENWDYMHQEEWSKSCSEGMQSPININSPYSKKLTLTWEDLTFDYCEVDNSYFVHTGNNLKLLGNFGKIKYNNKYYEASEITFFKSSEHTYGSNNKTMGLEMQILHENYDGQKLIIVVNYQQSTSSSLFMSQLEFTQVKGMAKGDSKLFTNTIDVGLVMNQVKEFVQYQGSLSEPPCTAGVEYLIVSMEKQISKEDLDSFPQDLVGKRRPVQDRKGRDLVILTLKNSVDPTIIWPDWPDLSIDKKLVSYTDSPIPISWNTTQTNTIPVNSEVYPHVAKINANLPFSAKKNNTKSINYGKLFISILSYFNKANTTNTENQSNSTVSSDVAIATQDTHSEEKSKIELENEEFQHSIDESENQKTAETSAKENTEWMTDTNEESISKTYYSD